MSSIALIFEQSDGLLTRQTAVIAAPTNLQNWTPAHTVPASSLAENVIVISNNDPAADATVQLYGSMDGVEWGIAPLAQTDNTATDTYVVTELTATHATTHFYEVAGNWNYLAVTMPTAGSFTTGGVSVSHYGRR